MGRGYNQICFLERISGCSVGSEWGKYQGVTQTKEKMEWATGTHATGSSSRKDGKLHWIYCIGYKDKEITGAPGSCGLVVKISSRQSTEDQRGGGNKLVKTIQVQ